MESQFTNLMALTPYLDKLYHSMNATAIILILGVLYIIHHILIRFKSQRRIKFASESFNHTKSAMIFKLRDDVNHIRIAKISQGMTENPIRYRLYNSKKYQIISIEPGYYYIDKVQYTVKKDKIGNVCTFSETDWLRDNKQFLVPSGAFHAKAGAITFLGEISIYVKYTPIRMLLNLFGITAISKYNNQQFVAYLYPNNTPDEDGITINDPTQLPILTQHSQGNLAEAKQWLHQSYPEVTQTLTYCAFHLPGTTIDIDNC